MSFTHMAIGAPAVAILATLAIQAVTPEPKPIVVHSLTYENGFILQDRSVKHDGDVFYATWNADIIDGSGQKVCHGEGSWNYPTGRNTYPIPLNEWVGDASCLSRLEPGEVYTPVATWFWGVDQTSKAGDPFVIAAEDVSG